MESFDWSSDIKTVFDHLSHTSALFVQVAGADPIEWTTQRGSLLMNEENLVEPLRVIRRWAASIPDVVDPATRSNQIRLLYSNSINQLTTFLDATLLVLYRDGKLSSQWITLKMEEQRQFILSLSISIQCLYNLLSAIKTLDQLVSVRCLQSLLSVLVTGSRPRLLLGQAETHPLSTAHASQCERLFSYCAILYYSLLLHFESDPSNMDPSTLDYIANKLVNDPVVFESIIMHCQRPVQTNCPSGHSQQHYQLLLTKLAEVLSAHKSVESDTVDSDMSIDQQLHLVTHATGLVLLLHSNDLENSDVDETVQCRRPQTIQSCLTFFKLYVARCGLPKSAFANLVRLFNECCASWCSALVQMIKRNPNDSEILLLDHHGPVFPFSQLRGTIHLLSESMFPSAMDHSASFPRCFGAEDQLVEQLFNRLCDLLLFHNAAVHWLDNIFPSATQPMKRHTVNGSLCTVYPSRLTRTWPTLPSSCVFAPCQAVGFLHDCLRCMTGLISAFPQLSFLLASHRTQLPIPITVSRSNSWPVKTAFQCVLETTNRDRINPFTVEWAILLIKLVLKPESSNEKALEGARILAGEMDGLKLIH